MGRRRSRATAFRGSGAPDRPNGRGRRARCRASPGAGRKRAWPAPRLARRCARPGARRTTRAPSRALLVTRENHKGLQIVQADASFLALGAPETERGVASTAAIPEHAGGRRRRARDSSARGRHFAANHAVSASGARGGDHPGAVLIASLSTVRPSPLAARAVMACRFRADRSGRGARSRRTRSWRHAAPAGGLGGPNSLGLP